MTTNRKIVMIVGAGAVENAWNPVVKSIETLTNLKVDNDGANFFLARLVYLLRFYSTSKQEKAVKLLEMAKENANNLKAEIAEQLKIAQNVGEIRVRNEFLKILRQFVFNGEHSFCIISTNWDTVIDEAINSFGKLVGITDISTFHLHGSMEDPNHLYLPSEVICEPYRTLEEEDKHGINHAHAITFLNQAHQVILYGLSIDPLDAELSLTLSGGLSSSNLEEIVIINPDYEKVANRIDLIIAENSQFAKISCYNPSTFQL